VATRYRSYHAASHRQDGHTTRSPAGSSREDCRELMIISESARKTAFIQENYDRYNHAMSEARRHARDAPLQPPEIQTSRTTESCHMWYSILTRGKRQEKLQVAKSCRPAQLPKKSRNQTLSPAGGGRSGPSGLAVRRHIAPQEGAFPLEPCMRYQHVSRICSIALVCPWSSSCRVI